MKARLMKTVLYVFKIGLFNPGKYYFSRKQVISLLCCPSNSIVDIMLKANKDDHVVLFDLQNQNLFLNCLL